MIFFYPTIFYTLSFSIYIHLLGKYGLNVCFAVFTITSGWGHEEQWKITGTETLTTCKSSRDYDNEHTYNNLCCLPTRDPDFQLTCIDKWGDGWNGAYLEINGKRYCQNLKSHEMNVSIPNPAKKECGVGKNTANTYIAG